LAAQVSLAVHCLAMTLHFLSKMHKPIKKQIIVAQTEQDKMQPSFRECSVASEYNPGQSKTEEKMSMSGLANPRAV